MKNSGVCEADFEYPTPTIQGIKGFPDDNVCYVWAVFNKADCQGLLDQHLEATAHGCKYDLALALTGWRYAYRGPAAAFSGHPSVRVSRNRILVTQRRGLDI